MTHTLAAERAYRRDAAKAEGKTLPPDRIRSIAYFCGVVREPTPPESPPSGKQPARRCAISWLRS